MESQRSQRLPSAISQALACLFQARQYAEQTCADQWDFAVEIDQLVALGLTPSEFRLLWRGGLVEHRREITRETDTARTFLPVVNLTFDQRTCFVLTDKGAAAADALGAPLGLEAQSSGRMPPSHGEQSGRRGDVQVGELPTWDTERRELHLHGSIVKRFRWPAANQEIVLKVFEEEGWPPRIDDPLPPQPEQSSKRRLNDTIKCLNRKQINKLLHFRGDGTGEGVIWERQAAHAAP